MLEYKIKIIFRFLVVLSAMVFISSCNRPQQHPASGTISDSGKNNLAFLNSEALKDLDNSQYEAALHGFDNVLARDPGNITATYGKTLTLFRMKKYKDGIKLADECLKMKIDRKRLNIILVERAAACSKLADRYDGTGDALQYATLAEESIKRAITNGGNRRDFLFQLVNVYSHQGKFEESLELCRKILQEDPRLVRVPDDRQRAQFYFNMASIFYDCGDREQAVESFNKALQYNPNMAMAYKDRAFVYFELGDMKKALADVRHFKKLSSLPKPGDAHQWSDHAIFFFLEGDKKNAIKYINKSVAIGSIGHLVDRAIIHYHYGHGEEYRKDYIRIVKIAHDKIPNNASEYDKKHARMMLNSYLVKPRNLEESL